MKYTYYKGLDKQEIYNISDGLSTMLHEMSLKRLGLDYNTLDTDTSNEILDKIDDAIENMHTELESSLEEYRIDEKEVKHD